MDMAPPPSPYSASNRRRAYVMSAVAIWVIALADRFVVPSISFGFLYLYPIILASGFMARWQTAPFALLCALLTELGQPTPWAGALWARLVIVVTTFTVAGLFAAQMGLNRRRLESQLRELGQQIRLRQEAEEELRVLIETSAAAIVTVGADGKIIQSNQAAERMLGFDGGTLRGQPLVNFLPFLAGLEARMSQTPAFRTMVEGRGRRNDGSQFFAQVWFSTYQTSTGPRLAAIVWDASEQVREREELGLRQLVSSSKIFMGAVSHEVRNLCAAISVVHLNLAKNPEFASNPDFQALGSLVGSLKELVSSDLKSVARDRLGGTDLNGLLEELSIIARPTAEEAEVRMEWEVPRGMPPVRADRSALLQVLLNLVNNAIRAARAVTDKRVSVVAYPAKDAAVVRICNPGPPIEAPEGLFQPYQAGSASTGLGLYVSRAILRTFGGELRYSPQAGSNCFLVELALAKRTDRAAV